MNLSVGYNLSVLLRCNMRFSVTVDHLPIWDTKGTPLKLAKAAQRDEAWRCRETCVCLTRHIRFIDNTLQNLVDSWRSIATKT